MWGGYLSPVSDAYKKPGLVPSHHRHALVLLPQITGTFCAFLFLCPLSLSLRRAALRLPLSLFPFC